MKKLALLFVIVSLLTACGSSRDTIESIIVDDTPDPNQTVSIAVFLDGIRIDLNKPKYTDQTEYLFLDSKFPGLIRYDPLEAETWGDFFATVPIKVSQDCLTLDLRSKYCEKDDRILRVFMNGSLINNLSERPLRDGDRVLISLGDETGIQIQRQINAVPRP